jgi:hypothetical protein
VEESEATGGLNESYERSRTRLGFIPAGDVKVSSANPALAVPAYEVLELAICASAHLTSRQDHMLTESSRLAGRW